MMNLGKFKYKRLDEICSKVTDGTHDSPKRKEKGRFLVTSKHIKGRSIDYDNAYLISEEDYTKINMRSKVDQWDVLISMIGEYCGFCYIERSCEIDYAVKNVGILKAGDKETAEWIYYYLNSPEGRNELYQRRSGTSQPYLSLKTLREFPVKFFENSTERGKITKQLSALDDKIELNNQMNQTLEEMAQAIFKEWFVEFNFPNEDGVPYKDNGGEMEESELGMIPKGWKVSNFGEVSSCYDSKRVPLSKNKRAERQGEFPYYGATSIMDYVDDYIFEGIYLMLGEDGSVIKEDGTPFVQYVWGKIWVNNHAHVLQGKNGISTEHLLVFSKQMDLNPYITGAVQLKLNQRNMNSIPFIRANSDIENRFNKVIQPLFSKIRAIYDENQTLIKTRDTLLPKLMSGEVRV